MGDSGFARVSALDGRYALAHVPAGTVAVRARMIGFEAEA